MTMIGIISLAGIVVNNAIVLIDYTNLLFERRKKELGMGEGEYLNAAEVSNCIAEAGKTRLRPVLLTAITTILGLVPLAIGLNIDFGSLLSTGNPHIYVGGDNVIFWGPMSWTIIFGLSVATFPHPCCHTRYVPADQQTENPIGKTNSQSFLTLNRHKPKESPAHQQGFLISASSGSASSRG